jgi:hypothetical protein
MLGGGGIMTGPNGVVPFGLHYIGQIIDVCRTQPEIVKANAASAGFKVVGIVITVVRPESLVVMEAVAAAAHIDDIVAAKEKEIMEV